MNEPEMYVAISEIERRGWFRDRQGRMYRRQAKTPAEEKAIVKDILEFWTRAQVALCPADSHPPNSQYSGTTFELDGEQYVILTEEEYVILTESDFTQNGGKMNLRPLRDRVIVLPIEPESKTPGGIVLPDTAKEKPTRGIVLAVGDGKRLEDGSRQTMDVQVGDHVVYSQYAGTTFELGDEEYVILTETDLLAIITPEAE